ncbi:hypothetical protein HanIR_Chr06g0271791 [Helianthus annuus]|nr:hypothetical protein HanIR_Chr06g0271791 [Helianthus annuus]
MLNDSICTSADVLHDETIEYLARINDDEWDMVHESLWGPRVLPTQSKTSTSSVIVDMEHEVDYNFLSLPQQTMPKIHQTCQMRTRQRISKKKLRHR